ncbi:hypothetical protein BDF19DRAFT_162370 [Syncephalis fuscata]|nr:hypothetical protein BDF19DRAFT_162370 [Syncephalis fuscata]
MPESIVVSKLLPFDTTTVMDTSTSAMNTSSFLDITNVENSLSASSNAQTTALMSSIATTTSVDPVTDLANQVAVAQMAKAMLGNGTIATPLPQIRMSPEMQEQQQVYAAAAAAVAAMNNLSMPINSVTSPHEPTSYMFTSNTAAKVSLNTMPTTQAATNPCVSAPATTAAQNMLFSNAAFAAAAGVNFHDSSASSPIETLNSMLSSPADVLRLSTDVLNGLPNGSTAVSSTAFAQMTNESLSSPLSLHQRQWSNGLIFNFLHLLQTI